MPTTSDDPLADLARLEGVPSAHAAALAAVDGVLRDRGVRAVEVADVATAAWMSARDAVALAASTDADTGGPSDEQRAAATVRMYAEVPAVSDLARRSPGQAMARLHTVWGRGLVPDDELGVVRSDPATADRLRSLQRLLTRPTRAPALVLAGVVHAELWAMQPFHRGAWAVALGMEQAVVIASGVDQRAVIPLATGHHRVGDHAAALRAYATGTANGARAWLLHESEAVTRAAEESPVNPGRRGV